MTAQQQEIRRLHSVARKLEQRIEELAAALRATADELQDAAPDRIAAIDYAREVARGDRAELATTMALGLHRDIFND